MKKITLIIAICTLGAINICAQTTSDIINKVTEKTKSYSSIKVDFAYTMVNPELEINEENKGQLKFKQNKYKLELYELALELYCDGENTYTHNKEAKEVTIESIEEGNQMMNPATLLTMYNEGYNSELVGSKNIDGTDCYQIDLTPEDLSAGFKKAEMFIDKQTLFVKQAKMYVDGGTTYTLNTNQLETNKEMPDDIFVFDQVAHPNVEVFDFR